MAKALSCVDSLGSFTNEGSAIERFLASFFVASFVLFLCSVDFNLSTVGTLDEAIDTVLGDSIYRFLLVF